MVFASIMAYRRRSLALALIAIGFAAQWVPVGAHRPGRLPVPLLHGPAVRDPGPRLLRGRAVARARRAGRGSSARVAAGAGHRRRRPRMWLLSRPLCALRRRRVGQPGLGRPARRSSPTSSSRSARSACSSWSAIGGRRPGPRRAGACERGAGGRRGGRRRRGRSASLIIAGRRAWPSGSPLVALLPDTPIFTLTSVPVEPIALIVGAAARLPRGPGRRRRATPAATSVGLLRRGRSAWFVVVYPNIVGAAPAVGRRQRLPGPPADLPVRVPVPGEHGRAQRRDAAAVSRPWPS